MGGHQRQNRHLPLAESITDFRELIIEGNDDDHYPRLFHTAAEAGSIVLSFVGMNFVNGLASGKATLVRIADTSVQIIGHRSHVMEGKTSDTQCLTITRISARVRRRGSPQTDIHRDVLLGADLRMARTTLWGTSHATSGRIHAW